MGSMETSMAQLSPEQSWFWAEQLQPESPVPGEALFRAPDINDSDALTREDRLRNGCIHYAAYDLPH